MWSLNMISCIEKKGIKKKICEPSLTQEHYYELTISRWGTANCSCIFILTKYTMKDQILFGVRPSCFYHKGGTLIPLQTRFLHTLFQLHRDCYHKVMTTLRRLEKGFWSERPSSMLQNLAFYSFLFSYRIFFYK